MKIVDFNTFCKMPAGTIFAPYEPCVLKEELAIKVDAGRDMPKDYPYYEHCFNGVMSLSPWLGDSDLFKVGDEAEASFEIYDGDTNDYCDYDMFLVFDEADIDRMIKVLLWVKGGCKEEWIDE